MLMKVVLPAPLVPIRPTTESFSIAALTSFAAVTAPKFLHSARASRTVGIAPSEQGPKPLGQEDDDHQQRGAERKLPRIRREIVGGGMDRFVNKRAGERRDDAAGARQDGDEDELAGRRPERHVR